MQTLFLLFQLRLRKFLFLPGGLVTRALRLNESVKMELNLTHLLSVVILSSLGLTLEQRLLLQLSDLMGQYLMYIHHEQLTLLR